MTRHIWPLNEKASAGVLTILSSTARTSDEYRGRLVGLPNLKHVKIERLHTDTPEAKQYQ